MDPKLQEAAPVPSLWDSGSTASSLASVTHSRPFTHEDGLVYFSPLAALLQCPCFGPVSTACRLFPRASCRNPQNTPVPELASSSFPPGATGQAWEYCLEPLGSVMRAMWGCIQSWGLPSNHSFLWKLNVPWEGAEWVGIWKTGIVWSCEDSGVWLPQLSLLKAPGPAQLAQSQECRGRRPWSAHSGSLAAVRRWAGLCPLPPRAPGSGHAGQWSETEGLPGADPHQLTTSRGTTLPAGSPLHPPPLFKLCLQDS